ncbi:HAD family hydrolase [Olsenella massiliensis]|uniref:HAD family hydrolase n=1 Tax=Olsenella massiliensis TaxID=1622075 RepID=UPI0009E94BD3|nr:HAD family phosphatase [Olsenella massiliensis]
MGGERPGCREALTTQRGLINAVIFDMGNVLMRFDGMSFSRAHTSCEEDARLVFKALFASTEWSLLDAGVIDEETMERVALARLPERLHEPLRQTFANWDTLQEPIGETCEIARALHEEGHGVYLLSNAGLRFERIRGSLPVWDVLDGWIVSAYERLMKPDPRIFRLLCERYGLDPRRCLFVDDNADNVEGARVAGLRGHVFRGTPGLRRELARLDMDV